MEGNPPLRTGRRELGLTEPQEDYLKQILLLSGGRASVTTRSLAERLRVRAPSVTGMIQRLAVLGLVDHQRYRGVRLTDPGRLVALEVLRHHRLAETFLTRTLGYGWDEVHEEAERLEHVISERLEARIDQALGHPTHDPHGDPIPDSTLTMPCGAPDTRLSALAPGSAGRLTRVGAQDPSSLALLTRLGLEPGARVEIIEVGQSSVRVGLGGRQVEVPGALAENLWLEEER
jgi:DtxR family Mn-dependent transcriptional regulator